MFNITKFFKKYSSRTRWNQRIKTHISTTGKLLEFDLDKSDYFCSVETAIDFISNANTLKHNLKLELLNELLKRRILELKSENNNKPATTKTSTSLESDHFNVYGVRNLQELAENIIKDLEKSKIENISNVFKEYVYFFTYFYKYNSIRTHISNIRKAIKESDLSNDKKEAAILEFKFPDKIHDFLNDGFRQNIRVSNMTEVLLPLEIPLIVDFVQSSKKYLEIEITKENKRTVFTHLSTLVALSIGRRLTEIVSISEVIRIADYKVKIIGLGKKRNNEKPVEIIIPTLFLNASEVITALNKLRSIIPKGLKSKESKDKFAHNLADFKILPSELWVKGDKFTSFRAMYAVISELLYNQNNIKEENKKPQATFMQELLGHGSDDFTTYTHYYKRQILIKDFDMKSYLKVSKTAMI